MGDKADTSKGRDIMNISQAKEQIKNAMTAYFEKDEFGEYLIPVEEQRPVFLIGPPGIGKTQAASEIAKGGWFRKDNLPNIPEKLSIARMLLDAWLGE